MKSNIERYWIESEALPPSCSNIRGIESEMMRHDKRNPSNISGGSDVTGTGLNLRKQIVNN